LLLFLLCIIMLPHSVAKHPGTIYSLLVDLPIFLITTVSIGLFYIIAQRHLSPQNWLQKLLLVPLLLSLAIGMSINNARAVLEALFGHQSGFMRTPKYGDGSGAQAAAPKRRFSLNSLLSVFELMFGLYFLYCATNAILNHQWTSVPFLLLFLFGFFYVFTQSMGMSLRPLPPNRRGSNEDPEAVAA
ncbi:MAG TPA: glycosyl transferase family 2, partial [Chthoniobacterales bacterium]